MPRPTISFSDETYKKLQNRMLENGIKTLSDCVRELVDLGLRIEESAAKSSENDTEIDLHKELLSLKALLKNNLIWSLESRLLARFLVETNPHNSKENNILILEQYKNKALSHIDELVE